MSFADAAETHLDDVFGYLAWFTGDRFVAEDLTGETFERALRLWHRFDAKRGSERPWLCQIARTTALDHFRSERRRTRREQLAAVPERYEERVADGVRAGLPAAPGPRPADGRAAALQAALGALTAGEREVVALRVVLDIDASSAARILGISPTNVT